MVRPVILLLCLALSNALFAQSDYAKTKYPVVLVHGMFGWDDIFGVVDYFYKIPHDLEQAGAKVFVANVAGLDSSEVRGEQLIEQVENILAISGAEKVHLIGHSQGAPTSRYVEAVRPEIVASVTSVSGSNFGSPVAELFWGKGSKPNKLLTFAANSVNSLLNMISGGPTKGSDFVASLKSLTRSSAASFNKKYPRGLPDHPCESRPARAENGTYFFSIGGSSAFSHAFDPGDLALGILSRLGFGTSSSDGLIGQCSSHLGFVIRDDYEMNHIDSMNHFFGLRGTDPLPLYRQILNRLKKLGL